MVKIFIDPGHGGSDPGAVSNGLQEKNITLTIAKRISEILTTEYNNVSIQMSRTGDQTISLNSRTNAANKWGADFYMSVHINSGGGVGFESFVYPRVGRPTLTYQEKIHKKILEQVQWNNRGLKQANFHVLRETNMPAILTENGFIDHSGDASKLKSSSFLNSLARGHAEGIASAFGLTKKVSNSQPNQPPKPSPPTNRLFRVQIGAFKDKSNADEIVGRAKAKGFQTYVKKEDNLFKVQIGAFTQRKNADELVERAEAAGFNVAIIIE